MSTSSSPTLDTSKNEELEEEINVFLNIDGYDFHDPLERAELRPQHFPMDSNNAFRWYLREHKDKENRILGSNNPQPPVTVDVSEPWKCSIALDERIPTGWFSIILGMSFKNVAHLETMDIHVSHQAIYFDPAIEITRIGTILRKEELDSISRNEDTRLRLHQIIKPISIHIFGGHFEVSFEFPPYAEGSFELQYIELNNSLPEAHDLVVYGDDKPQDIFRVGRVNMTQYDVAKILAYTVSSSGMHVATLTYQGGQLLIDVWDLPTRNNSKAMTVEPQYHSTPSAHASFTAKESICYSEQFDITFLLTLSSTGSEVAFGCLEPSTEHEFTCQVLKSNFKAPADHDISRPWSLEESSAIAGLENYYGCYTFYTIAATTDETSDRERFLACNGQSVLIYDVTPEWQLVHTITLAILPNVRAALSSVRGIQGNYMAWTGFKGVASVWDIDAGKVVSHVFVEDGTVGMPSYMSADGSKVAVSAPGALHVYETISGVKLGTYTDELGGGSEFEVVLGRDELLTEYDTPLMEIDRPSPNRAVVSLKDMAMVKTGYLPFGYRAVHPVLPKNITSVYVKGLTMNVIQHDGMLPGSKTCSSEPSACTMEWNEHNVYYLNTDPFKYRCNQYHTYTATAKRIHSRGRLIMVLEVSTEVMPSRVTQTFTIPLGPANTDYSGSFLRRSAQLVIVTGGFLQIWQFSAAKLEICELIQMWSLQDDPCTTDVLHPRFRVISEARVCSSHGTKFSLSLKPTDWDRQSDPDLGIVTVPISDADSISSTEEQRNCNGVFGLVDMYADADVDCKQAIARYLASVARASPKHPISCIETLVGFWTPDRKDYIDDMLARTLLSSRISWVPVDSTVGADPVAMLLILSKKQPSAIDTARIILDYCLSHANSSKNLTFLSAVFNNLDELTKRFPELATECLSRTAYIPVMHRPFIIKNHVIIQPPASRFQLPFWKPKSQSLKQFVARKVNPIMEFCLTEGPANPEDDYFTLPVFMASFDAIWRHHDAPPKMRQFDQTMGAMGMKWCRDMVQLLLFIVRPSTQESVRCFDLTLEDYDNPAIAALVSYKWSTIGLSYWRSRFLVKCCFYILVLFTAIMQVYSPEQALPGLFIAVIALAAVFLVAELWEILREKRGYFRSGYNALDVLAYGLPLAACVDQLVAVHRGETLGNTRILSFSVLAVFLHMGDDGWRLAWIAARLRSIEAAENYAYGTGSLQSSRGSTAKHIYFTATPKEVRAYNDKYNAKRRSETHGEGSETMASGLESRETLTKVMATINELRETATAQTLQAQRIEEMQKELQLRHEELKGLLNRDTSS
ncbi:hypothetical protein KVV02_007981 [Mortierella alpina]|uniref:Uncharacterized protein n=1 Tax=Mortierella alpina TaxID=64518 RepID=A0A9P8A309_MORAP|nr:hypothetical protein KVV02_007981 [Mortierella alpina]